MAEWNLPQIPKIFFGYWGTDTFPFVRWATLKTFRKHHPDWQMILYRKPVLDVYGDKTDPVDYWTRLDELNVEVRELDVEKEIGMKFPLPYITIFADVMRYVVFTKYHGGFYVDLDNLFYRSLESMPFNRPENANYDVFLLSPPYHHWLLSKFNSAWANKVLDYQIRHLPTNSNDFLGTTAITEQVPKTPEDKLKILPLETTEENFRAPEGPTSQHAVCLNWHGSGVYGKYFTVNEENYKTSDHTLAGIIRYCLDGAIGDAHDLNNTIWINRGG